MFEGIEGVGVNNTFVFGATDLLLTFDVSDDVIIEVVNAEEVGCAPGAIAVLLIFDLLDGSDDNEVNNAVVIGRLISVFGKNVALLTFDEELRNNVVGSFAVILIRFDVFTGNDDELIIKTVGSTVFGLILSVVFEEFDTIKTLEKTVGVIFIYGLGKTSVTFGVLDGRIDGKDVKKTTGFDKTVVTLITFDDKFDGIDDEGIGSLDV